MSQLVRVVAAGVDGVERVFTGDICGGTAVYAALVVGGPMREPEMPIVRIT